jgi:hypothetical protein
MFHPLLPSRLILSASIITVHFYLPSALVHHLLYNHYSGSSKETCTDTKFHMSVVEERDDGTMPNDPIIHEIVVGSEWKLAYSKADMLLLRIVNYSTLAFDEVTSAREA